jgi:methionine biosynthesis protein MetW
MVEASGAASELQPKLLYQFKESPYSSHSVLMQLFPAQGRSATVLDVGCGNGYLGAMLASRGFCVTGIERRSGYGSDFPPAVELVEADLEQGLPPLQNLFDYVLCADILEHLREPERLLHELRRVMKPEGKLIASLPNSGNIYFRLQVAMGRFPQHDKGLFDRTHLHFCTLAEWKRMFSTRGYRVGSLRVTGIPFGLLFPARAQPTWITAAEWLSYNLARFWKTLMAYQFVVTAVVDNESFRGD